MKGKGGKTDGRFLNDENLDNFTVFRLDLSLDIITQLDIPISFRFLLWTESIFE